MIKLFRHKVLRRLFETGSASGVQASRATRIRMQVAALNTVKVVVDMDVPGFHLRCLKRASQARWSVSVNGDWRITFVYKDGNVYVLDYEDYQWPCTIPLILANL